MAGRWDTERPTTLGTWVHGSMAEQRRSTRKDLAPTSRGSGTSTPPTPDGGGGEMEERKDKVLEMREASPMRSLRRSSSTPNIRASAAGSKRPKGKPSVSRDALLTPHPSRHAL